MATEKKREQKSASRKDSAKAGKPKKVPAAPVAPAKASARKPQPAGKEKKPVAAPSKLRSPYSIKDLQAFREMLMKLRDRITGQISFLSDDSLRVKDDTPSDDRTDDFDREFALNLVSSEHDALFEIDEALRRIDEGRYGLCEISSKPIEKERLRVIPYARYCVEVQSELERGKTRYRPFGSTISQSIERNGSPEAPAVEEAE